MTENGRKRVGHGRRARLSAPLQRLLENADVENVSVVDYLTGLADVSPGELPEFIQRLIGSQASLESVKDAFEIAGNVAEESPETQAFLDGLNELVGEPESGPDAETVPFICIVSNIAGMALARGVALGVALERDRAHGRRTRQRSRPGR